MKTSNFKFNYACQLLFKRQQNLSFILVIQDFLHTFNVKKYVNSTSLLNLVDSRIWILTVAGL